MRAPDDLRSRAATRYRRALPGWAADPGAARDERLVLALDPPTQSQALHDPDKAAQWVASWRQWEGAWADHGGRLERASRRWASMGTQQVPVRAVLDGAAAVARACGRLQHWRRAEQRAARIRDVLAGLRQTVHGPAEEDKGGVRASTGPREEQDDAAAIPLAIASVITAVADYPDDDVERLLDAVGWLATHPASGLYLRQLPLAGMDTKWLETRRRVVVRLLGAVRGEDARDVDLGLLTPPQHTVRVKVLDAGLAPSGLRDLAAPVAELNRLWPASRAGDSTSQPGRAPAAVIIMENLTTFLALEDRPGTVALWGAGYAVDAVRDLDWVLRARRLLYWGDIDIDGLTILARLRTRLPQVRSILMGPEVLERYAALVVPDPAADKHERRSPPEGLTASERRAWEVVSRHGTRLEQERVAWPHANEEIRAALDEFPASLPAD
ncbi:hypothetical protein ATCC27039_23060 [Actinomyces naeslundii]|nr:DUF3322 domain-containing protein [Actinomyces naeslundii]BDH78180.1 hypothetical protein ATCC27039_23060 [Actinomyces naeslundii]